MTVRKVTRTMSNTRILIVDGSNVVMRCALGGELSSAQAVPTASNMIERATRECEAITILSKLIEGTYPDWNRIIPADNNIATLPRAELLRSVERIALVADDIHMEFTGSALHLKSHGKRGNELVGDATDCLLIASNVKPGVPTECVFSTRYLRDALTATADDSLEFHLAPTRLCLLKAPTRDWRAVIAPVKKEEKKAKSAQAAAKQPESPAKQAETPKAEPVVAKVATNEAPTAPVTKPRTPVVIRTKKPELVGAV